MAIKIRIVSDFDDKGIKNASISLDNLAKSAGVALAAIAASTAAIAVASVREFAKFDGALVKSQAIMGDLTKTMEEDMARAAREVALATTFSAEQAAESFYFLASAGLDAEASISALPVVAQFAQAGMFDMALATDLLTDAQSALGLTIKNDAVANMENMIVVSDTLARASQLANATIEQFSTSLTTKAGTALKSVEKDIAEGAAALAVFADQGVKGEIAGTQLTNTIFGLAEQAQKVPDQFEDLGISVFDASGKMNNFADIADDFTESLGDMTVEQRLATLSQLGFTKQARAGILLLIDNGGALRDYEGALRDAGGTAQAVADKQLTSFNAQLSLLGSAAADVGIDIGSKLAPRLEQLIPIVKDLLPEIGEKLTAALARVDWEGATENVGNFIIAIVDNIEEIGRLIGILAGVAAGIIALNAVVKIATTLQLLWNLATKANPYVLLALAIAATAAAAAGFIGHLRGLADGQREVNRATDGTTGELNRFNNLKLYGITGQIEGVSAAARQANIDMGLLANGMIPSSPTNDSGSLPTNPRPGQVHTGFSLDADGQAQWFTMVWNGSSWGPRKPIVYTPPAAVSQARSGPSAKDIAFERVQEMIQSSQGQLALAQKNYNDTVATANQDYADSILRLQTEFDNKLAAIVQGSQDRLRNAYRSAVEVDVGRLFDSSEDKSVDGLISSMTAKLDASKGLLSKSADLASQGFTQTFIEQIVSAGVETGNELAGAILESTPETQENLRALFEALETESATGMDSLAAEIYEKQGLATAALEQLYATTQSDLSDALIEQQATLAKALEEAATALYDSVAEISTELQEQIDDMDGMFGGLGKTLDQFLAKLQNIKDFAFDESLKAATMPGGSMAGSVVAASKELQNAAGIAIDSASDVAGVLTYLDDRIAGASAYANLASTSAAQRQSALGSLAGFTSQRNTLGGVSAEAAVGTVININVKTDSSQSLAMVGKSLGNTLTKYVTGGGQVIVSPV
jgi:TP901 family phage tail tape measure protein